MLAPVRSSVQQILACTETRAIDSSQGLVGTDHVATVAGLGINLDALYVVAHALLSVTEGVGSGA
jgi:hypothetical protein